MRKYIGFSLVSVMCISIAMSYGFARTAKAGSLNQVSEGDAMLKTMDASLAAKLNDYLQIVDRLQRLSSAESAASPSGQARVLGGEPAVAPARVAPKVVAKAQPQKAWWADYELNMVVYSDKSRSAVISGQFVREGDVVRNEAKVIRIDKGSVTLERQGGSNLSSSVQDGLKTLYVKAR